MTPLERFRKLCIRRGLTLGAMHDGRPDDFAVAVAAAATRLESGAAIDERGVNDRLRAWLAGSGAFLDVDHVELRRWLVDLGLWSRDDFGRAYTRPTAPPRYAAVVAALASEDLDAIAHSAHAADVAAREARKAAWLAQQSAASASR